MSNLILPPPLGTSNSMYEATPQGPGTPGYSLTPGDTGTPGITTGLQGSTLGTGISGSTVSAPAGSGTPNTMVAQAFGALTGTGAVADATASGAGSLADYLARAIIIVLGFIFVAIALNMLRPGTVPMPGIKRPV